MLILTTQETSTNADPQWNVFTLFQAPVSWRSTLQCTVALSTMEAEYIVMTEAIYLAKNQVYHARTKHINARFHFVWKILNESDIEL